MSECNYEYIMVTGLIKKFDGPGNSTLGFQTYRLIGDIYSDRWDMIREAQAAGVTIMGICEITESEKETLTDADVQESHCSRRSVDDWIEERSQRHAQDIADRTCEECGKICKTPRGRRQHVGRMHK